MLREYTDEMDCVALSAGGSHTDKRSDYILSTAFLKNVYTALRFDPPAVGFARLSDNAQPKVKPSSWAAAAGGQYLTLGAAGVAAVTMLLVSM